MLSVGIRLTDGFDLDVLTASKAKLAEFSFYAGPPDLSTGLISLDGKATLGTTGATGGYVLPNNLVDSVVKPNVQVAIYPTCEITALRGREPLRISKSMPWNALRPAPGIGRVESPRRRALWPAPRNEVVVSRRVKG